MGHGVEPLTVGSLFAGIGGFDLGLERTGGFRTVWFCEQGKFCQRVLAKHWPGVPCYEDVCRLMGADVGPVDVLCGGFPCQDISLAGKGAGIEGARSGLWSEYARLIGETKPRWVIVENVAALLGRGLSVVLADLSALGYDAEWDCIPASAVGAPHRRDRLWVVAYPQRVKLRQQPVAVGGGEGSVVVGVDGPKGRVADPEGDRRGQGRSRRSAGDGADGERFEAEELADPERTGLQGRTRSGQPRTRRTGSLTTSLRETGARQWESEPDVGRVANGIPARVDRLRSLGNALVPQIAEWIGWRILQWETERG